MLLETNVFFCFFLPLDLHEVWHGMMSTHLITEVKAAISFISTWMGEYVSSRPGIYGMYLIRNSVSVTRLS